MGRVRYKVEVVEELWYGRERKICSTCSDEAEVLDDIWLPLAQQRRH
jgi:hypothetical protein